MQESPFKGKTGVQRLWNALGYSLQGMASAFRHEDAFRQECLLAAVLIPAALLIPVGGTERALLIASVLLVLIVELLNSAVEAAVVITKRLPPEKVGPSPTAATSTTRYSWPW